MTKVDGPFSEREQLIYDDAWATGWRDRDRAAKAAGLPSTVPLLCARGCRVVLDYEQGTPWGLMPAAMEVHAAGCRAMAARL